MGRITVIVPSNIDDFITRYQEEDECISSALVVGSLPEAKEAIRAKLLELIYQVDKLKLKDIT